MARTFLTLIALGLLGTTLMSSNRSVESTAAEPAAKVLRHVVMYKFKDDLKPGEVQQVVDAFAGLPKKIDTIIGFEHGTNVSPEGKSEGFTHIFVVTFRDEKGRDAYLVHPAHADYVNVVKGRREKVIVFDYWTAPQ